MCVSFPVLDIWINNDNDYRKVDIFGKPMSQSLSGCNFLNNGDIFMLKKKRK